jgi:hypothetical protein
MTDQAPIDAKVVPGSCGVPVISSATVMCATSTARSLASLIAAAEEVGMSVDAVRRSIAIERLGRHRRPSMATGW